HERVPCEQHLVVEAGPHARRASLEQFRRAALHLRWTRRVDVDDVEDVAAEPRVRIDEVAALGDTEVSDYGVRVVPANFPDLVDRPAVELAFDAFGVRVLGGVEASGGVA